LSRIWKRKSLYNFYVWKIIVNKIVTYIREKFFKGITFNLAYYKAKKLILDTGLAYKSQQIGT